MKIKDFEIVLENTTKIYPNSKIALENINLKIPKESIFCLLGPNGAGKTTMVRLLNGILTPTKGSTFISGKDSKFEAKDIHKICGVVTESSNCYDDMTGYENIKFYGKMHNLDKNDIEKNLKILLTRLNMNEYIHRKVKDYSTGMKKKLMIAISLIHNPKVLFLDEPTVSLDPESSKDILDFVKFLVEENQISCD